PAGTTLMTTQDDETLVRRFRRGEREVFGEILDRYEKRVFNVAWRIVHDVEDARDVTQTVLTKVFTNIARYDARFCFSTWIYRIAVNESIRLLKKQRTQEEVDDTIPSRFRDAHELLCGSELSAAIQRCLNRLRPEYRVVVVLRHFADCSYREMSRILDIPEKTVKSRLFDARRMLRNELVDCGALAGPSAHEARRRRSDSA
ncbi:MAG TPA: sigma-70 family RNA polymerase sigma factor, partial [Candidatus Krumholzibacteria bacterium]|nr:sigma-70 family RNA polymerase sigma factor [Candidatus Krumholzibacteria bacterium]